MQLLHNAEGEMKTSAWVPSTTAAALELVLEGCAQPSGYTEPVLHRRRLELKAQQS